MVNRLFFLVLFISSFLFICVRCEVNEKQKKQEEIKECTLNIDSSHFMVADIQNGLIQYLFNDSIYHLGSSYSIFNKKGQILSTESKTKFNEILINEFNDGQIFRTSKYVWDSSIENYRPQELRVYRNGVIDEDEGDFVDVIILKRKGNYVEFTVEFVSAFNFLNGEILFGREIGDYSDDKELNKLKFNEKQSFFRIEKSKIVFGKDSTFNCMVKITTDSLMKSKYIQRSYSGDKWTASYLVKKEMK